MKSKHTIEKRLLNLELQIKKLEKKKIKQNIKFLNDMTKITKLLKTDQKEFERKAELSMETNDFLLKFYDKMNDALKNEILKCKSELENL